MKNIKCLYKLSFLFMALGFFPAFADADEFVDVGISKYAVLETTFNYTPIREKADSDSKRFTHLREGVSLFAKKMNSEFYEVDLGLKKPYWIEKRYVEVQGIIPEIRGANLSKIKFYEDKNNYLVKINTKTQTPYKISQNPSGLKFELYNIDTPENGNINVKYKNVKDKFNFSYKSAGNSSGILTLNYLTNSPLYGYDVQKEDNALIFKIRKPLEINPEKPLKGVKIALDPGHGGDEKGAVSGGIYEKDLNLQITKEVNKALKKRGAKTFLTRKKDVNKGLYERVDFANEHKADIFISIHQNSLPNPAEYEKKHGTGVYYYNENAKNLAYSVQKAIVKTTGFKDDGVFNSSFAVVRQTNPVSILVECGYIIHPYEREKLSDKAFQKTIASAIADGVGEYLKTAGAL